MPSRRYSDEQLRRAVATSPNIRRALLQLGLRGRGGNYETFRRRCAELGLDLSHLRRGSMMDVIDRKGFVEVVAASSSIAGTLRLLGMERNTTSIRRFHRACEVWGVDVSHFTGQGWRKGSKVPVRPGRPLEEVLRQGTHVASSDLRERLIREGVKDAACESCGLSEWQAQRLSLELDHRNGVRDDNRLENLRILCPNCHSQTSSYRGRNIGRRRGPEQLRML